MYRKEAGQKLRRSAGSILLGKEDITDEDGEVEDAEDSEDDGFNRASHASTST